MTTTDPEPDISPSASSPPDASPAARPGGLAARLRRLLPGGGKTPAPAAKPPSGDEAPDTLYPMW